MIPVSLLPAPGQSIAAPVFPYCERHEDSLYRRTLRGYLLMCFESRHGAQIHYSDEAHEPCFRIEVHLQSEAQLSRGDLESRTVSFSASKNPAAWKAAWRIARLVARATPAHVARIQREDFARVWDMTMPWHLRNAHQIV